MKSIIWITYELICSRHYVQYMYDWSDMLFCILYKSYLIWLNQDDKISSFLH